jgi:hypothetical protein
MAVSPLFFEYPPLILGPALKCFNHCIQFSRVNHVKCPESCAVIPVGRNWYQNKQYGKLAKEETNENAFNYNEFPRNSRV